MSEMRSSAAPENCVLATLRGGGRIWAVAAVHGDARRLRSLHRHLGRQIKPGDQLVYLGGYLGWGREVAECVDELLLFRRAFIARLGVQIEDAVFLRGAQEEMWQKLLQLQFAGRPAQVLGWMADHGIGATIAAYGGSVEEGLAAAEDGVLALTHWTGGLRQAMRQIDGHTALLSSLKHAAVTDDDTMLFVHAGLDPTAPLSAQLDHFWWSTPEFERLTDGFPGYRLVVRGHALRGGGLNLATPIITLDAGCGRGGPLMAACFGADGEVLQTLEG